MAILLALFLFTLALPFIPIDLRLRLAQGRAMVRLGWLFGLVGKDMATERNMAQALEDEEEQGNEEPVKWKEMLEILRDPGIAARIWRLARGCLGGVQIRDMKGTIRVGLADPAETGILLGYLYAVAGALSIDLCIEPSFDLECLDGTAEGTLRLWPYRLIAPILSFLASAKVLRMAIGIARRSL
ncbi:MAG: DUF2953 domain-containing protein [Methanotrichaceae archaeon]|nr:DUF2953 domain-containing protein [Methanotrichaceae archaeon]